MPHQLPISLAQAGPRRLGVARRARFVFVLCAVLAAPPVDAGRTDIDWMARSVSAPLIDVTGGLERVDAGLPAQPPTGPGAANAALVADMRIATHDEAKALLQRNGLSGEADAGAGRSTIAALLGRLPTSMPSAADQTQRSRAIGESALDCALFGDSVGVRRLLGAGDSHKVGESAGRESAMGLDLPVHCLATAPHAALPAVVRRVLPSVPDQGLETFGIQLGPMIEATIKPYSRWLMALAGTALVLVIVGLAAGSLARTSRRGRTTTKKRRRL